MSAPTVMTHPVAAWFADAAIGDAIRHISQHAASLREAHTRSDDRDDWQGDDEVRVQYETLTHNANELRALLVALRGPSGAAATARPDRGDDGRGLLERAIDVMRQEDGVSAPTLQKALKVGALQAGLLLREMERTGLITAANDDGWHKVRTS